MGKLALSLATASFISLAAMALVVPTGSQAQPAAAAPCGPVAYSAADQKYSGVPCTAPTPQAAAGTAAPCGPVAYSAADQKYSGVPCTAPTPKAEAGKPAPCGPVAYSAADQRTVVPCATK
jgi:hypothetical protein